MFSNDHIMFNLQTNYLYITKGAFDLITIYHLQTSKAKNVKNFMNISNLFEPAFGNFQVFLDLSSLGFKRIYKTHPGFFFCFNYFSRHLGKVFKTLEILFSPKSQHDKSHTFQPCQYLKEIFTYWFFIKLYYFKLVFSSEKKIYIQT